MSESGVRNGGFNARGSHRQLHDARAHCIVNRIGDDCAYVDDGRLATSRSRQVWIVHQKALDLRQPRKARQSVAVEIAIENLPPADPRLTTIRQPLANMGRIAAQCVLSQLNGSKPFRKVIMVEPELEVRESTCAIEPPAKAEFRKKS